MATEVRFRRGSQAEHATTDGGFKGAAGEMTVELPASVTTPRTSSAIWVHQGDNATGDRFISEADTLTNISSTLDQRRFLAKITAFSPLNNDGLVADPDILPNRWKYKWEEISFGSLYHNVAQVVTITVPTGTAAANGNVGFKVPNSSGQYVLVEADPGTVDQDAVATLLETAYNALSSANKIYTLSKGTGGSANVLTFTATDANKGPQLTPIPAIASEVTGGALDTGIAIVTGSIVETTAGDSYVPITGGNDNNLTSDPAGDASHTAYAVNLCELRNTKDFIFPGYKVGLQSANGVIPANYKVLPIGGTSSYTSNEPDVTGTGTDGTGYRTVDEEVVVEMVERRQVTVGTGQNQNPGVTVSSVDKFYYFQIPNALAGPC